MSDSSYVSNDSCSSQEPMRITRSSNHNNSNNSKNSQKLSAQKLFNEISRAIAGAKNHQFFTYEGVDPETGSLVAASLDEDGRVERVGHRIGYNSVTQTLDINIMPTFIHDCHQPWLFQEILRMNITGFLTPAESSLMRVLSGTTIKNFGAPYTSSSKEPDWMIIPRGQTIPTVVVEAGWSESRPRLYQDRDLWLKGGAGSVQLVLLFRWSELKGGRVKGFVEVWDLDAAGSERMLQTEPIFPTPNNAAAQVLTVTRGQLLGAAIPFGRNPNDTFDLSLDALRLEAIEFIRMQGLVPA